MAEREGEKAFGEPVPFEELESRRKKPEQETPDFIVVSEEEVDPARVVGQGREAPAEMTRETTYRELVSAIENYAQSVSTEERDTQATRIAQLERENEVLAEENKRLRHRLALDSAGVEHGRPTR